MCIDAKARLFTYFVATVFFYAFFSASLGHASEVDFNKFESSRETALTEIKQGKTKIGLIKLVAIHNNIESFFSCFIF